MTFTELNVLWFVLAVLGAALSAVLVSEAYRDIQALRLLGRNGAAGILAKATLIIEFNKLLIHASYMVIGFMSFLGPMPANRVTLAGSIIVASAAIMVVNSGVLLWANHKARKEIRKTRRPPQDDAARDAFRDAGRDPTRDRHRDTARDIEHDRKK